MTDSVILASRFGCPERCPQCRHDCLLGKVGALRFDCTNCGYTVMLPRPALEDDRTAMQRHSNYMLRMARMMRVIVMLLECERGDYCAARVSQCCCLPWKDGALFSVWLAR